MKVILFTIVLVISIATTLWAVIDLILGKPLVDIVSLFFSATISIFCTIFIGRSKYD